MSARRLSMPRDLAAASLFTRRIVVECLLLESNDSIAIGFGKCD